MPELETRQREIHVRAAVAKDTDERTIHGLAVPYGETITVWGQRERLAPGAVENDTAKLFSRHHDAIGLVTGTSTDAGWEIEGTFSRTAKADEAYTLARDGVYDGLSIGFEVLEYHIERDDVGDVVVYDRVNVREVSTCPFPAYPTATVTEVRHLDTTPKENPVMGEQNPTPATVDDVAEVREGLADLQRSITVLTDRPSGFSAPVADTRSAGQILKAIVAGDDDAIREYNDLFEERAYEGGTTGDAVIKPGWVGDLTRLFDASSGVLADVFSTGTLPAEGNSIEYAQLKANTITVTEQVNEGDDISMGKVSLETKTAPVKTYAGGTELSRKSIERATVSVVNTSLNALAIAAGVRKKLVLRAAFNALVAAQTAAEDTIDIAALATAEAGDWLDAVVDAAINFEAKGAVIDALIVAPDVFKALNKLETTGHRIFRVDGDSRTVGELDLRGLKGDLASLPVLCDTAATGTASAFVNGLALRQYDSALVSLSDDKISNLTKQFAVYRYGAVAPEIPGFVVPVEFAV